jgi:uncharacterized delta-60 repeat protein
LARLNSNGSVDMSFNPAQPGAEGFALQPNGKVHLGKWGRLNADGSLDSTFNFPSAFQTLAQTTLTPVLQSDGKVILAGVTNTIARHGLVRFNTDGSHDASLDTGMDPVWIFRSWSISSIIIQSGGKVLFGGHSSIDRGAAPAFVHGTNIYGSRLNADGSRDQTFTFANFYAYFTNIGPTIDPQVYVDPWDSALSVGAQSDGKVIIGGITYATYCDDAGGCQTLFFPFLDRAHANGSRDTNFHPGINVDMGVTDLAVLSNDKILVAGSFSVGSNRYAVARLNADGSLDNAFAPFDVLPNATGRGFVSALAVQGDGKVLIGGAFSSVNGTSRNGFARINGNGTLDTSFNPGTGTSGEVYAIALQPDGKVLIGGTFTNVNGTTRNRIARLNANGGLDNSFNPGSGPDALISAIAVQPDGNVLIVGDFLTVNGVMRPYIARLYGDFAIPALNIARSNSFAVVSWPAAFGNFQLQENTGLAILSGWSAVGAPRSTNNGSISVAIPATGSRKFLRLTLP